MPCENCQGLPERGAENEQTVWLDFGIKIISAPHTQLCPQERHLYQFFLESGLVWKVNHLDCNGDFWLSVQYSECSYELIAPLEGTYQKVPCDRAYPVPTMLPLHAATP